MNTLGKAITSQFYVNPESGYQDIKAAWKEIKNPTAYEHYIYALLRGKDWRKGLTPLTNPTKIANGGLYTSVFYGFPAIYGIPQAFHAHVKVDRTVKILRELTNELDGWKLPEEAYKAETPDWIKNLVGVS